MIASQEFARLVGKPLFDLLNKGFISGLLRYAPCALRYAT
jgi:hypothetical protein